MKEIGRTLNAILRVFQGIAAGQYFYWMFAVDKMASIDMKYCILFVVAVFACLHTLHTLLALVTGEKMITLIGFIADSFRDAEYSDDYYHGRLDGTQKEYIRDVYKVMKDSDKKRR